VILEVVRIVFGACDTTSDCMCQGQGAWAGDCWTGQPQSGCTGSYIWCATGITTTTTTTAAPAGGGDGDGTTTGTTPTTTTTTTTATAALNYTQPGHTVIGYPSCRTDATGDTAGTINLRGYFCPSCPQSGGGYALDSSKDIVIVGIGKHDNGTRYGPTPPEISTLAQWNSIPWVYETVLVAFATYNDKDNPTAIIISEGTNPVPVPCNFCTPAAIKQRIAYTKDPTNPGGRSDRKVIISVGGATAIVDCTSSGPKALLIDFLVNAVAEWGFDGFDLDIEKGTCTGASGGQYFADVITQVRAQVKQRGQDKRVYVSLAPQVGDTWGFGLGRWGVNEWPWADLFPGGRLVKMAGQPSFLYNWIWKLAADEIDYVQIQSYNMGTDAGAGMQSVQARSQYLIALMSAEVWSDSLAKQTMGLVQLGGTPIPREKLILGVPAQQGFHFDDPNGCTGQFPCQKAGFIDTYHDQIDGGSNALQVFSTLASCDRTIGGIMAWDIGWDCNNGQALSMAVAGHNEKYGSTQQDKLAATAGAAQQGNYCKHIHAPPPAGETPYPTPPTLAPSQPSCTQDSTVLGWDDAWFYSGGQVSDSDSTPKAFTAGALHVNNIAVAGVTPNGADASCGGGQVGSNCADGVRSGDTGTGGDLDTFYKCAVGPTSNDLYAVKYGGPYARGHVPGTANWKCGDQAIYPTCGPAGKSFPQGDGAVQLINDPSGKVAVLAHGVLGPGIGNSPCSTSKMDESMGCSLVSSYGTCPAFNRLSDQLDAITSNCANNPSTFEHTNTVIAATSGGGSTSGGTTTSCLIKKSVIEGVFGDSYFETPIATKGDSEVGVAISWGHGLFHGGCGAATFMQQGCARGTSPHLNPGHTVLNLQIGTRSWSGEWNDAGTHTGYLLDGAGPLALSCLQPRAKEVPYAKLSELLTNICAKMDGACEAKEEASRPWPPADTSVTPVPTPVPTPLPTPAPAAPAAPADPDALLGKLDLNNPCHAALLAKGLFLHKGHFFEGIPLCGELDFHACYPGGTPVSTETPVLPKQVAAYGSGNTCNFIGPFCHAVNTGRVWNGGGNTGQGPFSCYYDYKFLKDNSDQPGRPLNVPGIATQDKCLTVAGATSCTREQCGYITAAAVKASNDICNTVYGGSPYTPPTGACPNPPPFSEIQAEPNTIQDCAATESYYDDENISFQNIAKGWKDAGMAQASCNSMLRIAAGECSSPLDGKTGCSHTPKSGLIQIDSASSFIPSKYFSTASKPEPQGCCADLDIAGPPARPTCSLIGDTPCSVGSRSGKCLLPGVGGNLVNCPFGGSANEVCSWRFCCWDDDGTDPAATPVPTPVPTPEPTPSKTPVAGLPTVSRRRASPTQAPTVARRRAPVQVPAPKCPASFDPVAQLARVGGVPKSICFVMNWSAYRFAGNHYPDSSGQAWYGDVNAEYCDVIIVGSLDPNPSGTEVQTAWAGASLSVRPGCWNLHGDAGQTYTATAQGISDAYNDKWKTQNPDVQIHFMIGGWTYPGSSAPDWSILMGRGGNNVLMWTACSPAGVGSCQSNGLRPSANPPEAQIYANTGAYNVPAATKSALISEYIGMMSAFKECMHTKFKVPVDGFMIDMEYPGNSMSGGDTCQSSMRAKNCVVCENRYATGDTDIPSGLAPGSFKVGVPNTDTACVSANMEQYNDFLLKLKSSSLMTGVAISAAVYSVAPYAYKEAKAGLTGIDFVGVMTYDYGGPFNAEHCNTATAALDIESIGNSDYLDYLRKQAGLCSYKPWYADYTLKNPYPTGPGWAADIALVKAYTVSGAIDMWKQFLGPSGSGNIVAGLGAYGRYTQRDADGSALTGTESIVNCYAGGCPGGAQGPGPIPFYAMAHSGIFPPHTPPLHQTNNTAWAAVKVSQLHPPPNIGFWSSSVRAWAVMGGSSAAAVQNWQINVTFDTPCTAQHKGYHAYKQELYGGMIWTANEDNFDSGSQGFSSAVGNSALTRAYNAGLSGHMPSDCSKNPDITPSPTAAPVPSGDPPSCSKSCGGGKMMCADGEHPCNTQACPVLVQTTPAPMPCQYSAWSDWAPTCPTACGTHVQTRARDGGPGCTQTQGSQPCSGTPATCSTCSTLTSCAYMAWGGYGPCSAVCGDGVKTRHRSTSCNVVNGAPCSDSSDSTVCNLKACPVPVPVPVPTVAPVPTCNYNPWTAWQPFACPTSCGVHTQTRSRNGGISAYCTDTQGYQRCSGTPTTCSTCGALSSCSYGSWGAYGPCTARCGNGVKTRHRSTSCNTVNGVSCSDLSDSAVCNVADCPAALTPAPTPFPTPAQPIPDVVAGCLYSPWSAWAPPTCDPACGTHVQTRSRNGPAGSEGCTDTQAFQVCTGVTATCRSCSTDISCVYAAWGTYSPCSAACGPGVTTRHRSSSCPTVLGEACTDTSSNLICNLKTCTTCGWWCEYGTDAAIGAGVAVVLALAGVLYSKRAGAKRAVANANTAPVPQGELAAALPNVLLKVPEDRIQLIL